MRLAHREDMKELKKGRIAHAEVRKRRFSQGRMLASLFDVLKNCMLQSFNAHLTFTQPSPHSILPSHNLPPSAPSQI